MGNIIKNKNGTYVLPGIVSIFLPGFGQLFKGHLKKGVAIIVIGIAYAAVRWLLGWIPVVGWVIGAVGVIAWLINVIDAFVSKKDIKNFDKIA